MAETIYLSPTDEIASIKEKLDRAKGNPIVLIAPKAVNALRNPLTLKLIKRRADSLAKDVLLVTPSRTVRHLALFHGIPAFSSLTQVRRWRPRQRARGLTRSEVIARLGQRPRIGMAGLAVAVLAILAVILPLMAGYLFFPFATIVLNPAAQNLSETISITASVDAKAIDYQTTTIPGRTVEAFSEITDQLDIASKKSVPDANATGQVTFMNKAGARVVVPRGTLLGTKTGVRFRTVDEVTLTPTVGYSARSAILADQPGKAGNVERWAIDQVIDLQLSSQVSVVNENPTQGGTDKEVGAVTDQDRTRLEAQALEKAKSAAFEKLLSIKKPSESIYPQTVNVQTVDAQFDRKVGDETKTLSLKLVVRATGLAFEARDVNEVVSDTVRNKVKKGLELGPGGIAIKPLGAHKWSERLVSFYIQGDAKAMAAVDEEQIKREIAGKSKAEAEDYIAATFSLADRPNVKIEPDWNGAVPRFTWRIKLNLRTP